MGVSMQPARQMASCWKWLVVGLSTVALAAPLLDDALALQRKPRFKAQVDGKRFQALKRTVILTYTPANFAVAGRARVKRGVSRGISVNCLEDLNTIPVPSAPLFCIGTYAESMRRGAGEQKFWQSLAMELTIQSHDGTRVTGTFRGLLDPIDSNPEQPVTIEEGTFSATVVDLSI
jgi:hypothetical protein